MDVPTVMGGRIANGRVRIASVAAARIKQLLLSTALVGIVVYPQALQAQSWNGAVDSDFSNGANWSTGVAPTSTDVSTIASTPTTPVVAATTANAGQITMTGATLGINAGATLVLNTLTVGSGSTVTGAGAIATNSLFLDSGSVAPDVALGILATMGGGTISGAISGAGQMFVSGGFNYLTGANTYSGGTEINTNAFLTVGDSGTLGSITGNVLNNGTLTFTRSDTTSYGGVISGAGVVIKNGIGTLVLSGANTYSGATTILNGTLQTAVDYVLSSASALTIAAGATLDLTNTQQTVASLAGAGNVNLGAGHTFSFGGDNASTSFTGNFIGTLSAIKEGTGTFSFSGTGPSAGAIQINAGTLALTGAADFSGAGVTLQANTTLDISGANAGISIKSLQGQNGTAVHLGSRTLTVQRTDFVFGSNFSGVVDGSGGLTVGQNSSLRLFAANTYSGPTTLNSASATLDLRHVGAIATSSEVNLAASGATLDISNAGGDATIQALRGVAGSIVTLRNSNLVITNAASEFAGIIKPAFGTPTGGVILNGGHQTLSGINTYLGATTVNAGTLSVNGSIATSSLTTVNAGGTLGGTGTVGTTLIDGGALAPGNSIGTLNVNGNLVFTAASSYMVEVSPTAADRTDVTGTATLGGATVNAIFASGSYVEKQYTILNAAGGIVGTFGSVVNSNLPSGFKSSLGYDANNAYLNLVLDFTPTPTPTPTPSPLPINSGLNGNQTAVANALSGYFARTGSIPIVFGALGPAGLSAAAGETPTGVQQTTFNAMNMFMGVLTDPFSNGRGRGAQTPVAMSYAGGGSVRDAHAMITKAVVKPPFESRWVSWAAGFGGSQTTDGNATQGSATSTSRLYGIAAGADYWLSPQTVAGFAMAGGATSFGLSGGLGSGRSDLVQVGGFVRHSVGAGYLTAAAAYGWQEITTERTVGIGGVNQYRATFNANAYSARVEAGHRWIAPALGGVGLTPYAAAQITAFDLPAYAEQTVSGTGVFALDYASKTATATRSELGLRGDRSFALDGALLTLRGRAAWAHDFDTERSIAATFQALPGASFVVNGARPARDAALTTVSAEVNWLNGFSVAASFEGEFSDVTRSYAGKGVVRYAW
ncbi:Outer membrane autotransporter [Rhodopseudomonas palustris HaA2]|uniref:Outer membrane autotransporter n=1 Tax=Rhodopseudomonas palustris (strain HaA2) TaxID=316058 RepID=Q2IYM7_RHOP2|nr:autotransporter domain-containing protein [Rhodopseudomonas palustris]ABD06683.1 Outer membrane autotransporter [Rhodopseudomonas palustris HaA2]